MIELLLSIFMLIASVSLVYLLLTIDHIVHYALYEFGLQFSYDWANPYWMFFRISLVLLGLIATAASLNVAYFFWKMTRTPVVIKNSRESNKPEVAPPRASEPSLFKCSSCGRIITDPLRILNINSQGPETNEICPFCNATAVPVSNDRARANQKV